jgi:hypothetical protein
MPGCKEQPETLKNELQIVMDLVSYGAGVLDYLDEQRGTGKTGVAAMAKADRIQSSVSRRAALRAGTAAGAAALVTATAHGVDAQAPAPEAKQPPGPGRASRFYGDDLVVASARLPAATDESWGQAMLDVFVAAGVENQEVLELARRLTVDQDGLLRATLLKIRRLAPMVEAAIEVRRHRETDPDDLDGIVRVIYGNPPGKVTIRFA